MKYTNELTHSQLFSKILWANLFYSTTYLSYQDSTMIMVAIFFFHDIGVLISTNESKVNKLISILQPIAFVTSV